MSDVKPKVKTINKKENQHRPLTEEEKQLVEAINKGDIEKAKSFLILPSVYVDCLDENGMSPLQHACYKGNATLVGELLARGADPNSNQHDMGYTALMFAGLAGSIESVEKLLRAGAKTYRQNSVGRTATQMAAFVGNHKVVSVINNFLGKDEVEYFTKPDGPKQEVRLHPEAASPLHALVVQVNLSPIKMCLHVDANPSLLQHLEQAILVLELLRTKFFSHPYINEVLSIKLHIISVVLRRANKYRLDQKHTNLQGFIKKLVAGMEPVGLPEGAERLLRASLKEFPYAQSQMLQQIVRELSGMEVGDMNSPTALEVITSHLNGQQFFPDNETTLCTACADVAKVKKCSACLGVAYCTQTCQKLHWFTHKKFCAKIKELRLEAKDKAEKLAKLEADKEAKEEAENTAANTSEQGATSTDDSDDSKLNDLEEKTDRVNLDGSGDASASTTAAETS